METKTALPLLSAEEIRILGVLMEKAKTTPEYYPMTINAIAVACNQKTSRKPVVQYDEQTVTLGLDSLKKRGLVSTATGGSSRTVKYKHNFAIAFPVLPSEVAIICLLMLRGPQTPGELNTNSGRMYEFESLEEVSTTLEKLATLENPFVTQLPRRSGQKELRYAHLLAGPPDFSQEAEIDENSGRPTSEIEKRLAKVEDELEKMRSDFDKLMRELMG